MLEFFDIIPWTTDSTSYPLVFLGGEHDQNIYLYRKIIVLLTLNFNINWNAKCKFVKMIAAFNSNNLHN